MKTTFNRRIKTYFTVISCALFIFSSGLLCSCKTDKIMNCVTTYLSNSYSGENQNVSLLASYGFETKTLTDKTNNKTQKIKVYSLNVILKDVLLTEVTYGASVTFNGKDYKGTFSFSPIKNVYVAKIDIENFFVDNFDITVSYSGVNVVVNMSSTISKDILPLEKALERINETTNVFDVFMDGNQNYDMKIFAKVLSRKEKTYYYVSVSNSQKMYAFLIDAVSGEMLAKRTVF